MGNGQLDEVCRQRFELLAIGDGGGQSRGFFAGNALTDIGAFAPDLVLKVGTGLSPGGLLSVFDFETALLHGLQGGHLLENSRSLSVEWGVHFLHYV